MLSLKMISNTEEVYEPLPSEATSSAFVSGSADHTNKTKSSEVDEWLRHIENFKSCLLLFVRCERMYFAQTYLKDNLVHKRALEALYEQVQHDMRKMIEHLEHRWSSPQLPASSTYQRDFSR
jgi:hypothetical protein